MVLEGLVASFKSMFWVALLLGILVYSSSILCVTLFREVEFASEVFHFHTVYNAAFTMFTLCIVAEWRDIVEPVVDKYWWSALIFAAFIVLATFGILNLIIGVISARTAEVCQEYQDRQKVLENETCMHNIHQVASILFPLEDGEVTKDMMEETMGDPQYHAK